MSNNQLIVAPNNLPEGQSVRDVINNSSNITSRYQARLPVNGHIRLGRKKTSANGVEYPENVDFFVIDEVPELKRLIKEGEANLKSFTGFFVSNEIEQSYPHGLVLFTGGKKDSNGKMVGGTLKCRGTGPEVDKNNKMIAPGVAEYTDVRVEPATNREIKELVPRECLGEHGCPDAKNAKGDLVCKPRMRLFVMIPEISIDGVYEISTGSISSILDISSRLKFMEMTYGGYKLFPFTFYRDGIMLGQGKFRKVQHVLKIKPLDSDHYWANEGMKIKEKIEALKQRDFSVNSNTPQDSMSQQAANMSARNAANGADGSNSSYYEAEVVGPTPQELCDQTLDSKTNAYASQILDKFTELSQLLGTPNTEQKRKLFIAALISKNNLKDMEEITKVTLTALDGKVQTERAKKNTQPANTGEGEPLI